MLTSLKADEEPERQSIILIAKPKASLLSLVFFCTGGLSSLFVFNCLISMEPYWKERYGSATLRYILFSMNMGGIVGFCTYRLISKCISIKLQAIFLPPLSFLCSLGSYSLGEMIVHHTTTKSIMINIASFIVGYCGSILQNCFTEMCFNYGDAEIASMNTGMGLAGVLTALIALLQAKYFPNQDLSTNGLYYILFQAVMVIWVLGVCLKFYSNERAFKKMRKAKGDTIGLEIRAEVARTQESTNASSESKSDIQSPPSLLSTFKILYPLVFSLFCNFTITMSGFPSISLELTFGWTSATEIQTIILYYNVTDLIGKALFAVIPLYSLKANHLIVITRFAHNLFAAYLFGGIASESTRNELTKDMRVSLLFTGILGVMGGYLNSSLLALASRRTHGRHGKNGAFLMVLAIMSGLSYGSGVNVAAIKEPPIE